VGLPASARLQLPVIALPVLAASGHRPGKGRGNQVSKKRPNRLGFQRAYEAPGDLPDDECCEDDEVPCEGTGAVYDLESREATEEDEYLPWYSTPVHPWIVWPGILLGFGWGLFIGTKT